MDRTAPDRVEPGWHQRHSALSTEAGLVLEDLGILNHRAHIGERRQLLVRRGARGLPRGKNTRSERNDQQQSSGCPSCVHDQLPLRRVLGSWNRFKTGRARSWPLAPGAWRLAPFMLYTLAWF